MVMVTHQDESQPVPLLRFTSESWAYLETVALVLFNAAGGEHFHVKVFDELILTDTEYRLGVGDSGWHFLQRVQFHKFEQF